MLILKLFVRGEGFVENSFTLKEKATALHVAQREYARGNQPLLVEKTYNNPCVRILFDYAKQRWVA